MVIAFIISAKRRVNLGSPFFFLLLVLSIATSIQAQGAWTIYNTANSDLPNNTIYALLVDGQNNKWIGTDLGLARFDGTQWTVYNTQNSPLPGNSIRALDQDDSGAIWIGVFNHGLTRFDGANWTTYTTQNSGLPDDVVRAIACDTGDVVWVGSSGGLSRMENGNWTTYNQFNSNLFSNNIASLQLDGQHRVWVGTINGGLSFFENGNITTYRVVNSPLTDNTTLAVHLDLNENKWIATPAGGLNILAANGVWYSYNEVNSGISTNSLNAATTIGTTGYLASQNNGLIAFNGSWTIYNTANSPLPENLLQAIVTDPNGVLWIGTGNTGLVSFDPALVATESISLPPPYQVIQSPEEFSLLFSDNTLFYYRLLSTSGVELLKGKAEAQTWTLPQTLPAGFYLLHLELPHERRQFQHPLLKL